MLIRRLTTNHLKEEDKKTERTLSAPWQKYYTMCAQRWAVEHTKHFRLFIFHTHSTHSTHYIRNFVELSRTRSETGIKSRISSTKKNRVHSVFTRFVWVKWHTNDGHTRPILMGSQPEWTESERERETEQQKKLIEKELLDWIWIWATDQRAHTHGALLFLLFRRQIDIFIIPIYHMLFGFEYCRFCNTQKNTFTSRIA